MFTWLENWLLKMGLLNPEGLIARAALCAEDVQKLRRTALPAMRRPRQRFQLQAKSRRSGAGLAAAQSVVDKW
jgi:hypothetical protein